MCKKITARQCFSFGEILLGNVICKLKSFKKSQRKIRQFHEKLSKYRKNEIVLQNVLENVDILSFIFIFCQRIRVINITFWYTANNLESSKCQGK